MLDTAKHYEAAVAKERVAFERMMAVGTASPNYGALVQQWKDAMQAADAARAKMIAVFGMSDPTDTDSYRASLS